MIKITYSQVAIILSICIVGYFILSNKYWRDEGKIIENDIISYYGYLPAIFIFEDPSLHFVDKIEKKPEIVVWFHTLPEGGRVFKMTMGVSYFYLPFFVIAHQLTKASSYSANGYTIPYKIAISVSSFFIFISALIFLRKYLLNFFDDHTVSWTILIVGLGSNLVNYVIREPGMSHVYSFFMISCLLHFTHLWYKSFKRKDIIIIGLLFGVLILVRPINILLLLVFVFYEVNSISLIGGRLRTLFAKWQNLLIAAVVGFVALIPQLIYWKYNTGNWVFYSYIDEGFFFLDPKFMEGLFSYRKGWLLYTPLMVLSFIGFIVPCRKGSNLKPILLIFFILYLYITFSWWCWWYGGSFGMRPLIDIYPLLSIPIAFAIQKLFKINLALRISSLIVVAALILLSLFQNYQYREGIIHYDSMTKKAYWLVWARSSLGGDYWESLKSPDYEAAKNGDR